MNATADLRSEHIGVGRMLGILDAMAVQFDSGGDVVVDDIWQSIEFVRVFVDKCHHYKEEILLFPAMREAELTSAEETIRILLDDHVHGREAVGAIAAATQRLADGDGSASTELAQLMRTYTKLLHAHIRREENDCFSIADRELPAAAQDALAQGYERVEREVIGEGRHEAFHVLLDRLAQTYHT